jgi:hypothetical protein
MTLRRLAWFALLLGLTIAVLCLSIGLVCSAQREERLLEKAERLDHECMFVRGMLVETRRLLWSPDPERQRWGEDMFLRQARNDWHETNVCASDSAWVGDSAWVSGPCLHGDRACMLHVTDWALAVVR